MTELKPCPFCGSEPEFEEIPPLTFDKCDTMQYDVHCPNDDCGVYVSTILCKTPEQAVRIWNTQVELGEQ